MGALRVVTLALALAANACAADPLPGYRAAPAEETAALTQVVREYYELLDRAELTGDAAPLYARFPRLAQGEDRRSGVNWESFTVAGTRSLGLRDARTDVESYEPLRAFVKGDAAVVYVHGLFTWTYQNGSQTKGELPVRLDLAREGGEWTIVRSDEQVLGETPAPTPR
jgi:hypothetical protein